MILILTRPGDEHTLRVIAYLEKIGADLVSFETGTFPQHASLTMGFADSQDKVILSMGGNRIDLDKVHAVWNRRAEPAKVSSNLSSGNGNFAFCESKHQLEALWFMLQDRFWVNSYESAEAAEHKPYQLKIARAVGFDVPRTLMTNDPSEVEEFFERCKGQVIYKAFTQYRRDRADGRKLMIFTNRVLRDQVLSKLDQLSYAPSIFQEYIPKVIEFRVTVVGPKIFAAAIDSQKSSKSKDDWRRYDLANTPYRPYSLPAPVEAKIHELMRQLRLVFGCIDLILTPDGQFVFLEINQSGQWLWVEFLTGMPILQNFAEMLLQGTAEYDAARNGCLVGKPL